MFFSFAHILDLLVHYKYYILFPISVVEGPIISILGGFLASLGKLNLWMVFIVVCFGDFVGDTLYYLIGYTGRKGFAGKFMKFFRISEERLNALDIHFDKHTGKTLLLGKFTHAFGTVVLVAAGAARISYSRFMFYNVIGTLPKSLILVLVGYYFGRAYEKINHYLNLGSYYIIVAGIVLVILYFGFSKISAKWMK